jgi:hypothetical protein
MSYHTLRNQQSPGTDLLGRVRQSFQLNVKPLLDAVEYLRRFSLKLTSDYDLATSIFVSKITKLDAVRDCTCSERDGVLTLLAYMDKTDFATEEKIYDVYGQLLELFPDTDIDVRVIELHGRSKTETNAEI